MTTTTPEQQAATIEDWSVAVSRLLERGAEPGLLYEAMLAVAVKGYAETYGLPAAADYLQKFLEDLEVKDATIVVDLPGDDAPLA